MLVLELITMVIGCKGRQRHNTYEKEVQPCPKGAPQCRKDKYTSTVKSVNLAPESWREIRNGCDGYDVD